MKKNILLFTFLLLLSSINLTGQVHTQNHEKGELTSHVELSEESQTNINLSNIKKFQVVVKFTLNKSSEPEEYKGFKTRVLTSAKVNFTLKKVNGIYFSFAEKKEVEVFPNKSEYIKNFTDTVGAEGFQVYLENVQLKCKYEDFSSKSDIDEYYNSKDKIINLTPELDKVSFSDADKIEENRDNLKDIFTKINNIKNAKFNYTLNLNENDPINYLNTFSLLKQKYDKAQEECNNALANWHKLYFKKGMESYSNGSKINYFKAAIKKANENGINYADPYHQIAKIEFQEQNYADCITYLDLALNSQPLAKTRSQIIQLYKQVFKYYESQGDKTKGEIAIKEWYYKAKAICGKNIDALNVDCENLFVKIKDRRTNEFIWLIAQHNFNSLGKAQQYLNTYQNEINNPEKLDFAFQNLFEECIIQAKKYFENNNLELAFHTLREFKENEKKFAIRYNNSVNFNSLHRDLYKKSLIYAEKNNNGEKYEDAIKKLDLCIKIQEINPLVEFNIVEINNNYKEAYTGIFNQKILNFKILIKQNDLTKAAKALDSVEMFYKANIKWLSDKESIIKQEKESLYESEFSKQFFDIEKQISEKQYIKTFKNFINLLNYIKINQEWLGNEKQDIVQNKIKSFLPDLIKEIEISLFEKDAIDIYYTMKKEINNIPLIQLKKIDSNINQSVYDHIKAKLTASKLIIHNNRNESFDSTLLNNINLTLTYIDEFVEDNRYEVPEDISKELSQIKNFIESENCKNNLIILNNNVTLAKKSIEIIDYISAVNYLDYALKINLKKLKCNFDLKEVNALKTEYYDAYLYQFKKTYIEREIQQSDFGNAIKNYISLEDFYNEKNLSKFGITHINFQNYIEKHENISFQKNCLIYYLQIDEDVNVINTLLRILYNKNEKQSFYWSLGKEIGDLDKSLRGIRNLKSGIKKFEKVANDKYESFVKGYKEGFKN